MLATFRRPTYFAGRARSLGLWLTLGFGLAGLHVEAASPASSKAAKPKPPAAIPVAQVPSVVEGLQALGSGPARLVWVLGRDVEDLFVQGKTGQLYVLDTEDGKGQRCLLEEVTSYAKPMLSPDGRQIVFTNLDQKAVFAVNFDGTGLRKLMEGYASDVWWDPVTSHTWVYVRQGYRNTRGAVIRCRLDDPKVTEKVWQAAPTGQPFISYFQLSRDGSAAVDTFPWPQVGLANISEGGYSALGKGCWPGIAPDDSDRCFYFTGTHNAIVLSDPFAKTTRTISMTTMPGLSSPTAFHPRWSNHPRILTVTAPEGKPDTELYAGIFDVNFTKIEKWVRITYNQQAECFGDAWFATGIQPVKTESLFARKRESTKPKTVSPGLVFRWENEKATNAIFDPDGGNNRFCRAVLEGDAVPNAWSGAELKNGALVADEESTAAALQACSGQQSFSLAFSAQAARTGSNAKGTLVSISRQGKVPALSVDQVGPALFVTVQTDDGKVKHLGMGAVSDLEPTQWLLVYADGLLECYRNGLMERSSNVRPEFMSWSTSGLRFGSRSDGTEPWQGALDGIEIFQRPLAPREAAELYTHEAGNWAQRTAPARLVVEAELVERSTLPDPAKIAPYTRALVESVWKVRKVLDGTLKEKRLVVLHWCILGSQPVETPAKPGTLKQLTVEPLEAHAQLQGELRATDVLDAELPVFYEVR
ncbi:LamG-like jellyroll fold domain-containing protein [Verrucomicrobium sp. BvORR034]|uniref:LamG-like jellyroll fold domain-containing protein n=1 Tax=Verrucomicrobium sp. BvORR034 TaxID=1396418 RepID=UPI0009DE6957|nr:LamG-like jellyroll fold domain-containing protein [Verrucomicrobium sp. BvORR034]